MDNIDVSLILALERNCRLTFRELAEENGLSVGAVHRRISKMEEQGVIRGYTAEVGFGHLPATGAAIFGPSKATDLKPCLDELVDHEDTERVVLYGGNYLYVSCVLRDISELDSYTRFVQTTAQLVDPTVGLSEPLPTSFFMKKEDDGPMELGPIDFRIIRGLEADARRSSTELSEELGLAPRTVRRHLDKLIEGHGILLGVDLDLAACSELMGFYQVRLRLDAGLDKLQFGQHVMRNHKHVVRFQTFHNLPALVLFWIWGATMNELKKSEKALEEEDGVDGLMFNILLDRRFSRHTWRNLYLEEQVKRAERSKRQ